MYILVVNAGSSSLKYQLFEMEKEVVLAKGLCERIGLGESAITHKNLVTGAEHKAVVDMPTHNEAIALVLKHNRKLRIQICSLVESALNIFGLKTGLLKDGIIRGKINCSTGFLGSAYGRKFTVVKL